LRAAAGLTVACERGVVYNRQQIAYCGSSSPIVYTGSIVTAFSRRLVSGVVIVDIRAKGQRLHWPHECNIPEHHPGQPPNRQPQ
jgi:hypothetical protein